MLTVQGDTVQVLQPWGLDPGRSFFGGHDRRLEADELDRGLKMAVGPYPSGLPAGSVAN